MEYQVNLQANVMVPQSVPGTYFSILETGAAPSISIKIKAGSRELEAVQTARRGLQAETKEAFSVVELLSTINTTVKVIISDGSVKVDSTDGASVLATIVNTPLPVVNDRGAPGNPVHVSGLLASDSPATGFQQPAPVAMGAAPALIIGADLTRKALRLHNLGPDPVAVGGVGITWATRALVLDVGDIWVEEDGANLAWHGVCDAGKTANVAQQGILA